MQPEIIRCQRGFIANGEIGWQRALPHRSKLGETVFVGYAASDWVCSGGTQSGANITVGIGGEATCTITNDDLKNEKIVRREYVPAGAKTYSYEWAYLTYVAAEAVGLQRAAAA